MICRGLALISIGETKWDRLVACRYETWIGFHWPRRSKLGMCLSLWMIVFSFFVVIVALEVFAGSSRMAV